MLRIAGLACHGFNLKLHLFQHEVHEQQRHSDEHQHLDHHRRDLQQAEFCCKATKTTTSPVSIFVHGNGCSDIKDIQCSR